MDITVMRNMNVSVKSRFLLNDKKNKTGSCCVILGE